MKKIISISFKMSLILFVFGLIVISLNLLTRSTFFFSFQFAISTMLIYFLVSVAAFHYVTEKKITDIKHTFLIFFIAFTMNNLYSVGINVLLHNYIDPYYKERIADYKIENQLESFKKIEQKKKVKINFDIQKERSVILAQYSNKNILTNPITSLPFNLILSLVISAILTKFGTLKGNT